MSGPMCPIRVGMLYFILLMAFPLLSVQAGAPNCDKLKQIAGDLEKSIQSKRFAIDKCDKMDAASLNLPANSIGFSGDWDYRCKDFSAIDMQLKSIENEIALLKGIDSLKSEINQGLETLSKFKNGDQAKEASAAFMKNLDVAHSIELFLATNNTKSENILSKVVEDPVGWTDINSFAGLLRKHCGSFSSQGETVCKKGFALSEDTYQEINAFVSIGKETERKFNKKQIKDLTNAMTIKKGEEDYSFSLLAADLKGLQPNGLLAAEDIQKIKNLPELGNDKNFDFLKKLKTSIKNIKGSEELVQAQSIPTRFSSVLNDLKKRQEWEMKSKLSLVLNQYNDYLPSDVAGICDNARELKGSIADCLTPLKKSKDLKSYEQAAVGDLIAEFKYSENQVTKLDELIKDCIPNEVLMYPAKCEGMISQQMADLVAKSQVLNALKTKHLQASPDLIIFRNFALEKLHSGECMNSGESNIPDCYSDLGNISREAMTLSGDAKDIIFVFEKNKEATSIQQLCLEGEEKVPFKDTLCALMDEDPAKKSKKKNDESYQAPVSPDNGNSAGKAWLDLGGSILNSVAGLMAPRQTQYNNPYAAPIYPYGQMAQPQDIKNQIMDPYVAHGFGNYFPTQGLRPYSSINSNSGTSSTYNFSGSSHFNSPVGW